MSETDSSAVVTPDVVQWRMKIFLRSPARRRVLVRLVRLLDRVSGQEVLEASGDDAISVAMHLSLINFDGSGEKRGVKFRWLGSILKKNKSKKCMSRVVLRVT